MYFTFNSSNNRRGNRRVISKHFNSHESKICFLRVFNAWNISNLIACNPVDILKRIVDNNLLLINVFVSDNGSRQFHLLLVFPMKFPTGIFLSIPQNSLPCTASGRKE